MAITCETVTVVVHDEDGAVTDIVMPAYTTPPDELRKRIASIVEVYLDRSDATGSSVSLGDFALYCVALASKDPREQ